MSKNQTLRALVNERLTAAAEEIFALFERTIAEYEEELCENQRKQRLLDEANPRAPLLRASAGVHFPSKNPPDPGLNQEIRETPQIKEDPEELSVKLEEDQLQVSSPESSAVCVKTEEPSFLQQRQTEHRTKAQEDIRSKPHFDLATEGLTEHLSDTDNDEQWECPLSCADAEMETEDDGDCNQVQIRDISTNKQNFTQSPEYQSAPGTNATANKEVMSESDEGAERKKHQCFVCQKRFATKLNLQIHTRVHTGERPYSCSICDKTFNQKGTLDNHRRIHTGEKLYSCSICEKTFARKSHHDVHMRTHTGDKPYSCSFCNKEFTVSSNLKVHMRSHTGEKPYSCTVCEKTFVRNSQLKVHLRTHTGEKPYSCSLCKKTFAQKSNLDAHARTRIHATGNPISCSLCNKKVADSSSLPNTNVKTHKEKPELS